MQYMIKDRMLQVKNDKMYVYNKGQNVIYNKEWNAVGKTGQSCI